MTLIYLKLLLTAIFWGGTFIAGRMLAAEVSPFCASFLRYAIASAMLVAISLASAKPLAMPRGLSLAAVIVSGATGVASYNYFFFTGLQYLEAGRAAVIIANNQVLIALASVVFLKERLGPVNAAGVLISVTGAVVAISRGRPMALLNGGLGWVELMILACVASWVVYSVLGKTVMKTLSPTAATTWASLIGSLMLLPAALHEGLAGHITGYSAINWICLSYVGICGTVLGFIWYYEGIRRIGPALAGLFINFVPIAAIVMGFFMLDEPLTPSLIAGTALVITGVVLANRKT